MTGAVAVTGASRGIGAGIAVELARRGYTVGCLSRGARGPEDIEVAPELAQRMVNLRCDVDDEASIRSALAALRESAGAIGGIVNNAGIHVEGRSADFATGDFARIMATNATALFVACREVHPHLLANGGGMIVNIGSYFDKLGVRRNTAYCASKAAVGAITRCLAVEWAKDGITVLDVAPGYVATNLNRAFLESDKVQAFLKSRIPVGRTSTPEEVARLVASLFDEKLSFLTGETIYFDGGQGMFH